jgi:Holliday junction resolvase-like predicted endonuclease
MKHLNKKIGMLGQKYVCDYFKENQINYWTNFDDNYNITDIVMERNDKICFVEISTKQFTTKGGHNVTGKNKVQIDNYVKRQNKYNIKYFIVFVDIKKKEIYGNYLDNLLNLNYYKGKEFPETLNCAGQEITFFNLHSMIKLCDLTKDQLEELSKLTFANKFNKYQLLIL